jgi:outer membrane protein assembly factor BamE (lipoprotein component of BamABCDE complex)
LQAILRDHEGQTMEWFGRLIAAVAALFAVAACDPSGQPYEDLRLARLKVGESTEQDVVRLFGAPAAVRPLASGKGLVYPLGPQGAHTLLLRIGADGRYQGRENLLTRENFGRVTPGMVGDQVSALLGPPGSRQGYPLKQQTAWEWRFLDGNDTKLFVVMFDANGRVVSTAIEEDPSRLGGG